MVDTRPYYYEDASPYLINPGDDQQINSLQHRGDGICAASLSENAGGGPAFLAADDRSIGGKVYVAQKLVIGH